jgi:hypothetical protein
MDARQNVMICGGDKPRGGDGGGSGGGRRQGLADPLILFEVGRRLDGVVASAPGPPWVCASREGLVKSGWRFTAHHSDHSRN